LTHIEYGEKIMAKKKTKPKKPKTNKPKQRTKKKKKDPLSELLSPTHLFLLLGISVFIEIVVSMVYYISEQTSIAPIMYIGNFGNFTSGENVIFFLLMQVIGIWIGLWFISAIFKFTKYKKGK